MFQKKMGTRSACEHIVFPPAQRPRNKSGLDSSVTWEVWRIFYTGTDLLLIQFLHYSAWMLSRCTEHPVALIWSHQTVENQKRLLVKVIINLRNFLTRWGTVIFSRMTRHHELMIFLVMTRSSEPRFRPSSCWSPYTRLLCCSSRIATTRSPSPASWCSSIHSCLSCSWISTRRRTERRRCSSWLATVSLSPALSRWGTQDPRFNKQLKRMADSFM